MRSYRTKCILVALLSLSVFAAIPVGTMAQESGGLKTSTSTNTNRRRRPRRRVVRRRTPPPEPPSANTIAVPAGTNLKVRLNDTLSSKTSRVGDKFTVTVIDPVKYNEATVRGHVASIIKSGKIKGRTTMNLDFDSIATSDGKTGRLHGYVIRVYGEGGQADTEGGVQSSSRSKQAIKRGGIGAAAGAIIGGIAGGGKGAAIGLILGGAGGAGSLAVQGSKELKLENGTELLIRVTR